LRGKVNDRVREAMVGIAPGQHDISTVRRKEEEEKKRGTRTGRKWSSEAT
jgi:hypothetical protein